MLSITEFRLSDDVEKRISELLDKQSIATLTQSDEVELERLSHLELQLQKLKAQAFSQLQAETS
ncbi:MAG: hypothetical protein AAF702_01275 [Chloroflexota bacterium]